MAQSKLLMTLRHRLHKQHESACILAYGPKGAGKSWLCLRMAKMLDKNFDLSRVVFSPAGFFALLEKGLPAGSCILYDEIGVGANSRDAMSLANRHLSFIAQTIRPAAICVFFTVPSMGLVDAQTRCLLDFVMNVQGHDARTGLTDFKFLKVKTRADNPKPALEHLQFSRAGGVPVKYISWTMKAPDADMAAGYDHMRAAYLKQLYGDASKTIESGKNTRFGVQRDGKKERPVLSMICKEILSNPAPYMAGGKFAPVLVREKFGIGETTARQVLSLVKASQKTKKTRVNTSFNINNILNEQDKLNPASSSSNQPDNQSIGGPIQ